MRRDDFGQAAVSCRFSKKKQSFRSTQRLEIAFACPRFDSRQVDFSQVNRKLELCRQVNDELRVFFCRVAANAVLQMGHFQIQSEFAAQLVEQMQQSHRIRSTGNRDQ